MSVPKALRVDRNDRWRTPRLVAAKRAQDATIKVIAPSPGMSPIAELAAARRAGGELKFDWLEKDEYPRGVVEPAEATPVQSTGGLEAAIKGNQGPSPAITEKMFKDYLDEAMKWSKVNSPRVWYSTPPESYAPPTDDDPLEFWADGTLLRWSSVGVDEFGADDPTTEYILFPWPVEILEGEVGQLHLRTGVDVVTMTWQPGAFKATVQVALGTWQRS